jgi:hypothetical protein
MSRPAQRGLDEIKSIWFSVANKQGWNASFVRPQPTYEARKSERPGSPQALTWIIAGPWKPKSQAAPSSSTAIGPIALPKWISTLPSNSAPRILIRRHRGDLGPRADYMAIVARRPG